MIDLLIINLVYVSYRLFVSGVIVKLLSKVLPYYLSVFFMAQLSFGYDTFIFGYYFNNQEFPELFELFKSNILYTLRVIAAWWLIKQIWNKIKNYWISVFIGAEITFVFDYFIFFNLFDD
jgi:hypothetical protein